MRKKVDVVDIEIVKDLTWDFKKELKIGHIRADYNDGFYNTWFGEGHDGELVKKYGIDLHEVQTVVNHIMYNLYPTFQTVVDICGGEGYNHQSNLFGTYGKCNYWLRFIPQLGEYNMYINVYVKEGL